MSSDPGGPSGGPGTAGAGGAQPSEEELRAAYEAELSRITSADMMLQAAVSLLNIASFRLAPPAGGAATAPADRAGDLAQVRDAIDGVRALLEILERSVPGELAPLRNALSQLQMAYAREMQASGAEPAPGAGAPASSEGTPAGTGTAEQKPGAADSPSEGQPPGDQGSPGPGPAESSGRLWVPGR
ncbi:MAG TPA: hypothetical protein VHT25_05795 [Solirubrobacteraceae bacterium]|jgi:hypothetical protein|nr:hypothetical protein [Solirubrobacteraceae bacterium]